jgi:hypothetical protein
MGMRVLKSEAFFKPVLRVRLELGPKSNLIKEYSVSSISLLFTKITFTTNHGIKQEYVAMEGERRKTRERKSNGDRGILFEYIS